MKAAILVRQNAPLDLAEVEVPGLEVGQVLVKVEASGICGKQIDEITGRQGPDAYIPHLLGHEGAGTVVEIGPGVRKVKPGDRVVLHWVKGSGIDSRAPRYRRGGEVISAGWVTTFNEYAVVSENRMTPVPADVPAGVLALLGCAVTTGLGIVFNNANLKPGQSIAVAGVGGVGLNVIQGAALLHAYPIVAIDVHESKLEWARRFGATHVVDARRGDLRGELDSLSKGRGFDAVVDTTGFGDVRAACYGATGPKGITVLAGVPFAGEPLTIDSFPLHGGRRLVGSHGGETVPDVDIPRYVELYKRGVLKLDELITHRCRLADVNDAIGHVRRGEVGRCVIEMPRLS